MLYSVLGDIMSEYLNHSQHIITAVDEFDFNERIKPCAIMEYFQDLATVHATEIGIGYEEMKAKNLCWILSRLSAVIEQSPYIGQEIIVTTFPHKPGMVDALRDYYVTDLNGKTLIRGTSRWCVVDTVNRAVRRCAPLFNYDDSVFNPEYSVQGGNPQLPDILSVDIEKVSLYSGRVNITDLDRNGHMNNARYADIVVNSCDFDFYSKHKIREFDFNFLSEMKIGDAYCVKSKSDGKTSFFEASVNNKEFPSFRACVKWD